MTCFSWSATNKTKSAEWPEWGKAAVKAFKKRWPELTKGCVFHVTLSDDEVLKFEIQKDEALNEEGLETLERFVYAFMEGANWASLNPYREPSRKPDPQAYVKKIKGLFNL
jgi:hypothetical protein